MHFTEIAENTDEIKNAISNACCSGTCTLFVVFNFFAEAIKLKLAVAFSASYLLRGCSLFLFLNCLIDENPFSFPFLSQNYFLLRSLYTVTLITKSKWIIWLTNSYKKKRVYFTHCNRLNNKRLTCEGL